jgi:hypothetical protein
VNDAVAMRDVLVARHGFRSEDVVLLTDGAATRDGILAAFRRVLVDPARPGDVGFFFYAGHGSRVSNSLSREPDRKDETVVPVDARDIRDKEIARLMAAAADRGLRLTAVFDSCHSGSISRGISISRKVRSVATDPEADARDPDPAPSPAEKGVLVVSAAQDYQSAVEAVDERNQPHGAFTAALLAVLRTSSPQADAESIFLRTRALLRAGGAVQEPVIDGPAGRRRDPLFGPTPRGARGRPVIAAGKVANGTVEVLGGFALGLAPGAVLVRADEGKPAVRLRIERVEGVSTSLARPATPGDEKVAIAPGDSFAVESWASPGAAALRVHVGKVLPAADVRAAARALAPLRRAPELHWVDDPASVAPTHVLVATASGWALRYPDGREEPLGPRPSARPVTSRLARERGQPGRAAPCDARPCLFVRLPVAAELAAQLAAGRDGASPISRAESEADALYVLAGRIAPSGAPEYAWVLAAAPGPASGDPSPLPARSSWAPATAGGAASLDGAALAIARIRAWLTLEPPPDAGDFPYRLAMRRQGSEALAPAGVVLRGGEIYELTLVAEPAALAEGSAIRYVYVLGIDSRGHVGVLFPADKVGADNRLPAAEPGKPPPAEIPLGRNGTFQVGEPFGTDTFVLLATREPIPSLLQLEQEAVMRGGSGASEEDALGGLLAGLGRTRGAAARVPGGWSIDRVTVTTAR